MPLWKLQDIHPEKDYVMIFLQNAKGLRDFQLCASGVMESVFSQTEYVTHTQVIPHDLLKARDVGYIAQTIKTVDGLRFEFDAHDVWFLGQELDDIECGKEVRWVTLEPPLLPPC